MISKEELQRFKEIWKNEFGEIISDEKALESATKLLTLMRIIYKPMTQEEYDKVQISERKF